MHVREIWQRAECQHHSGTGILPGASAFASMPVQLTSLHSVQASRLRIKKRFATAHSALWFKNLFQTTAAFVLGFLTVSCSHAAPLLKQETQRGPVRYTLHSPEAPARQHLILAHGFLRSPQTMHHLAESFSKHGIETACIKLKRSTPLNGNHAPNACDIIALREALGWQNVTYAGFSAGGLSALIAAAEDKGCAKLLLLDPVDQGTLGKDLAPAIRIPTFAILGKPGPGNAQRNASPMLAALPGGRIIEIPEATHCDFEARPSTLCHRFTGSKPDAARTAAVHQTLFKQSIHFLNPQNQQP